MAAPAASFSRMQMRRRCMVATSSSQMSSGTISQIMRPAAASTDRVSYCSAKLLFGEVYKLGVQRPNLNVCPPATQFELVAFIIRRNDSSCRYNLSLSYEPTLQAARSLIKKSQNHDFMSQVVFSTNMRAAFLTPKGPSLDSRIVG